MSNELSQISFREMQSADIAVGLELCRASRWNQLRRDWEFLLAFSPAGCRVAVKDEQVVGTVTTVGYQDQFSWIGMVLVESTERRQGIGTRLLQEAIDVLNRQPMIRLDATPAGREVYLKLGFVDEYRLSRMETKVSDSIVRGENNAARRMITADLPRVFELDRKIFGADRSALLEWMFAGAPEYTWIILRNGKVAGYVFGRHGFNFEHLGPIVAEEKGIAVQLVSACLAEQAGKTFILDAAQHDEDWMRWLASIGFREQRPFVRMFRGKDLHPGMPEHQFAILGPEFG